MPDENSSSSSSAGPQSKLNAWAHGATLVLGLIGTAVGIWATYQSNIANSQANVATAKAKQNSDDLQALQVRLQQTLSFANGIHEAAPAMAQGNTARGIPAMVEISRLYEEATTPQQKLVLIQIAQLSKQESAMAALSTLVLTDESLQKESNPAIRLAIDNILNDARRKIVAAATAPPAAKAPKTATKAAKPHLPSDDPPLTTSSNHLVASNAVLVASLPRSQELFGWVFAGDALGHNKGPSAQLIPRTSSIALIDGTASNIVPAPSQRIVACRDVNVRKAPFTNGALGEVAGIAPQGTIMTVQKPPGGIQDAIETVSKFNGRTQITARWLYVSVAPTPATVAQATAAPTIAASPGAAGTAAPATAAPMTAVASALARCAATGRALQ